MNELIYDKRNGNVAFRDSDHCYFDVKDPGKKYVSVTTAIQDYVEQFDSFFWSHYKALEGFYGVDAFKSTSVKKNLLDSKVWKDHYCNDLNIETSLVHAEAERIAEGYEKANREACDFGTNYHLQQEMKFYSQPKVDLSLFDKRFCGEFECRKDYYELDLTYGIYPEFLVYWEEEDLRISGQIDLLIKEGNRISLIDYKTNSKGIEEKSFYNNKTKSYKMMKYPVNNLQDCNKIHYTLQLSFYARLLQKRNPELEVALLLLKHCDREGYVTDIELEYLPKEIDKIIRDIKKKNYIQRERNKR
jgi:hypothetical protein